MNKVKYVCAKCGSCNIVKDAYAEWDYEEQEWVLHSTYDYYVCNDCGSEDIDTYINDDKI